MRHSNWIKIQFEYFNGMNNLPICFLFILIKSYNLLKNYNRREP